MAEVPTGFSSCRRVNGVSQRRVRILPKNDIVHRNFSLSSYAWAVKSAQVSGTAGLPKATSISTTAGQHSLGSLSAASRGMNLSADP